jgi:hypothetical protein
MSKSPVHYHVECAMCTGSLMLESDSLQEVFQIIRDHLEREAHMHASQPESKRKRFGKEPHTIQEIFDSDWFRWKVLDMQPLDKLHKQVEKDVDAVLAAKTGSP